MKRIVGLFVSIFFSSCLYAAELTDVEREQRKIVSRLYQATDASLALCPEKERPLFKESLKRFRETYPKLNELVEGSKFRAHAIESYSDDIVRDKSASEKQLSARCRYMKSLLDSMIDTASGQESVQQMTNTLLSQP
jgi:hypothetical protein